MEKSNKSKILSQKKLFKKYLEQFKEHILEIFKLNIWDFADEKVFFEKFIKSNFEHIWTIQWFQWWININLNFYIRDSEILIEQTISIPKYESNWIYWSNNWNYEKFTIKKQKYYLLSKELFIGLLNTKNNSLNDLNSIIKWTNIWEIFKLLNTVKSTIWDVHQQIRIFNWQHWLFNYIFEKLEN